MPELNRCMKLFVSSLLLTNTIKVGAVIEDDLSGNLIIILGTIKLDVLFPLIVHCINALCVT